MNEQTLTNARRAIGEEGRWVGLTLALVGGAVDAIGYLMLNKLFTSHMSGNTVAMTTFIAKRDWHEAWRHGEPLVIFFVCTVLAFVLIDVLAHHRVARTFSIVAGIEAAMLLAFLLIAHPAIEWMIALPAGAMGIQTALLRRVGSHSIHTTFVTGMISNAAQSLVTRNWSDWRFYSGVWACFAGGGIVGAAAYLAAGSPALALPIAGLAALVARDCFVPLTREAAR